MASRPPLVSADGFTPLRPGSGVPYRAADRFSQELANYNPGLFSADSAWLPYRDTIAARVQDIARNNGWASGLLQRLVDQAIGASFRLNWMPDLELMGLDPAPLRAWVRTVERKFRAWAMDPRHYCDASERNSLVGLLGILFRHRLADGECLALPHWIRRPDTPYRTALQVISPERLSTPSGKVEGKRLRGGIEQDGFGRPLAFHIRKSHPGDVYADALDGCQWVRVPRKTAWGRLRCLHFFEQEEGEQTRGKSLLAPVVEQFVMQGRYARTEMQAAVLNAVLSAWVKSSMDPGVVIQALAGNSNNLESSLSAFGTVRNQFHDRNPALMDGVRLPILFPGDEINFADTSRPHAQYAEFEGAVLRNIAAATGMSYEQLAQDWSKTNYSSARAALLESWKFLTARREHFAQGVATPLFALWLEDAIDCGEVTLPPGAPGFWDAYPLWVRCQWTLGPGRGWVDPTKEIDASHSRMKWGLSSLAAEAAEQGRDWEDNAEQLAAERERFTELGLVHPMDADQPARAAPAADPDDDTAEGAADGAAPASARLTVYEQRMAALRQKATERMAA